MTRQLLPIDAISPGRLGLNLQEKANILGPAWAVNAWNCVLDDAQRLACRQGYSVSTTTDITGTPAVENIFQYLQGDGTVETLVSWNGGIGNDIQNPEGNDISGAVTDTDGRWWFQNFNNKVIGFQHGQKPIVYSGTTFATVTESSGTAPTSHNGIGLCAFGRVWGLDSDGQTIKYSGLLDEADWGTASAGSIDMSNVWPGGMDEVTAIAAFNGALVVFGRNHIIIWDDNVGSQLGITPTQLAVVDAIQGVGCTTHWSVQHIGETDIVFLSRNGLHSLGRVVQEKSNPLNSLSKYVRDALLDDVGEEVSLDLRSTYNPELGLYIMSLPSRQVSYVFDVRYAFQDEEGDVVFPCTQWELYPTALETLQDGTLLMGAAGQVWTYGVDGDDGNTIRYEYSSPWLDLGEELGNRLKMLKRIGSVLFARATSTVNFKWLTDFDDAEHSITRSLTTNEVAEWNVAEWNLDEWSGGLTLQIVRVPARATAQYFQVKIESEVTGAFAVQQVELFTKVGRMA